MIIKAPCGAVEGMEIQGIHQFLSIPYAKLPVGALRFMPTEPAEPWRFTTPSTIRPISTTSMLR